MNIRPITVAALSCLFLLTAGVATAEDQERDRDRDRDMDQEQSRDRDQDRPRDREIYGSQLMTQQERDQYRARMRNAKSVEEREQLRKEHHEQMQERAKAHGMTLPDEPPERGMGRRMGDDMPPHDRGSMGDGMGNRGR